MPSSLAGVLIFVVLLAPGITYTAVRSVRVPERDRSVLRETAGTVLVSVICGLLAVVAFAGLRHLWFPHAIDIGALVRDPSTYWRSHYVAVFSVAATVLACACGVGALLAVFLPRFEKSHFNSAWHEVLKGRWHEAFPGHRRKWWQTWKQDDDTGIVFVACALVDGTHVSGVLNTFSTEVDETGDREVSLAAPIYFRPRKTTTAVLLDAESLTVSARQVKYLTASYYSEDHVFSLARTLEASRGEGRDPNSSVPTASEGSEA